MPLASVPMPFEGEWPIVEDTSNCNRVTKTRHGWTMLNVSPAVGTTHAGGGTRLAENPSPGDRYAPLPGAIVCMGAETYAVGAGNDAVVSSGEIQKVALVVCTIRSVYGVKSAISGDVKLSSVPVAYPPVVRRELYTPMVPVASTVGVPMIVRLY